MCYEQLNYIELSIRLNDFEVLIRVLNGILEFRMTKRTLKAFL